MIRGVYDSACPVFKIRLYSSNCKRICIYLPWKWDLLCKCLLNLLWVSVMSISMWNGGRFVMKSKRREHRNLWRGWLAVKKKRPNGSPLSAERWWRRFTIGWAPSMFIMRKMRGRRFSAYPVVNTPVVVGGESFQERESSYSLTSPSQTNPQWPVTTHPVSAADGKRLW